MALFTQEFLNKKRNELLDTVEVVEYEVDNSEWHQAVEQSREVSGNFIHITVTFPNTTNATYTITALRMKDADGTTFAKRDLSITVNAAQSILMNIRISYQEV